MFSPYLRRRVATADDQRWFGYALTGDPTGLTAAAIVASIEDDRLVVLVMTVGHYGEVYD